MMIRPFTLFCVFMAGTSGMFLYAQKHKTTLLDHQIAKIVYDTEKIQSRTTILRTEWTLLNQPDRLKTLTNRFLPQLRPLAPSQFIQESSLIAYLPPIQKEEKKDNTREQLVQTVTKDHQPTASMPKNSIAEPASVSHKEKEADLIANNTDQPDPADQQDELSPSVPERGRNPENTPTERKKQAHKRLASASSDLKTHKLPVPGRQENNTFMTDKNMDDDWIDSPQAQQKPQPSKKNIKTVSASRKVINKPSYHPAFSIADSVTPAIPTKDKETPHKEIASKEHYDKGNDGGSNKKTHDSTMTVVKSKKYTPSIKMARYNVKKKPYHSESAFGDDSDDLPAPVPFSQ